MEKQKLLNELRTIIERRIVNYPWQENDESMVVRFTESGAFETIEGLPWVAWAVKHSAIALPVIRRSFETCFEGREFTVITGSGMSGFNDYVQIVGKALTLADILNHVQKLQRQMQFRDNCERFKQLMRDAIETGRLISPNIVLDAQARYGEHEMIDGVSYVAWGLECSQETMNAHSTTTVLDMILASEYYDWVINWKQRFSVHYRPDQGKIIIAFDG